MLIASLTLNYFSFNSFDFILLQVWVRRNKIEIEEKQSEKKKRISEYLKNLWAKDKKCDEKKMLMWVSNFKTAYTVLSAS